MSQYCTLASEHSRTKKSSTIKSSNSITGKIANNIQKDLSHYEMLKKIGKGTFAVVYKAKHLLTNMFVAIKILDKRKIQEEKDLF